MFKRIVLALGIVALSGCMPHLKDVDSYNTMFRNQEVTPTGVGDPYTYGGIGEGSGGTNARQTYATDTKGPDFRDATLSGKLGEISRDRTEVPGALPGSGAPLPGTAGAPILKPNAASTILPPGVKRTGE